jgi:hypothetical protein
MPKISSSEANVPGTTSPSIARCTSVRDIEKPSAPASMPSRTIAAICATSSGAAGSFFAPRSPIT